MSTLLGTSANCAAPTAKYEMITPGGDDQDRLPGTRRPGSRATGGVTSPAASLAANSVRSAQCVRRAAAAVDQERGHAGRLRARDVRGRDRRRRGRTATPRRRGAQRGLERPRIRLRRANGGRGRRQPRRRSARTTRASTSCSEMSQLATTAELEAGGRELLQCRTCVGVGVEGDGVGQRRKHVGARDVECERVGQQRCAFESQRRQRGASCARRSARGSGASRPASPPRSARARPCARGDARASAAGAAPAARWRPASPSRRR